IKIESVAAMTFVPGDKILASTRIHQNGIDLWDVATGQKTATLLKDVHLVYGAFSADGKTLAAATDGSAHVSLLEVPSGKEQATLKGHKSNARCVAFSPDGKTLASGSDDGKIILWDLQKGRDVATIAAHQNVINAVAFSADGKTLASSSKDRTI